MSQVDHEQDVVMMRRAIRLAMKGRGAVEPNPMVGCVLVKRGQVIGEGYHAKFGGPHAEPTALANCGESPAGATAYVTLEPCCHTNKKTPPCVPALIQAKMARVVVGCVDPNPEINGKGLDQLRAAGISVTANILEDQTKQLIAPFIARTVYARPYVTLKWAETADGKIAGHAGARIQISNAGSMRLVHELRARSDAILVGINTVLSDNPLLIARGVADPRPLVRIVMDRQLRIPLECKLVQTAEDVPVIVRCGIDGYKWNRQKADDLARLGVDVQPAEEMTLAKTMKDVRCLPGHRMHLLIEPGPTLARACFEEGIVDRVWLNRSPTRLDDPTAPAATPIPGGFRKSGAMEIDGDHLSEFLNSESPVFFAAEASADFVLASNAR